MKLKSKMFYGYVVLLLAYVLTSFLPAPDKVTLTKYHLSPLGVRLLDVTIVIPLLIIWFAIFFGFSKLHTYAKKIRDNKDGQAVLNMSRGLFILAVGWPIEAIISGILKVAGQHNPSLAAPAAITTNYLTVAYLLAAFIFIGIGARGLGSLVRSRPPFWSANLVVVSVIVLGVVFCALIGNAHQDIRTTFHMSPTLVMLTLAIPYMYIWYMGLYGVLEIILYSRRVAGIVYRQSWQRLAFGLGSVLLLEVALQYLGVFTTWLRGLSLPGLLLLLYVLLLLLAAAFIVVALGAQKLMKLEEA